MKSRRSKWNPGEFLTLYHDAVYERTLRYVESLTDADFARIIDESWDPPVSLGVRLVSVYSRRSSTCLDSRFRSRNRRPWIKGTPRAVGEGFPADRKLPPT
jgi:hypothetical protein